MAQASPCQWGLQGSLGIPTGDLKDTAKSNPCLGMGGHLDYALAPKQTLRARFEALLFQSITQRAVGSTGGHAWTRDLKTQVQGWTLGAEYLREPFLSHPNLTLGAGMHVVRWHLETTNTLAMTVGTDIGTMVESSKPAWTKLGISLLAAYRVNRNFSAEARVLSSAYGWEGERVHLGQIGLVWTF
jgi:hypothetical protein